MQAQRGAQRKIETGPAGGTIGELGEGGRLEALADVGVGVHIGGEPVSHAGGRRGASVFHRAAVVAVAGGDEVVGRLEGNARVTQAGEQAPAFGRPPLALQIQAIALDDVVFVALQRAGQPEIVDESLAPLRHALVVETGAYRERRVCGPGRVSPAQAGAAVAAVEVNDAARMCRAVLNGERNREVLGDLAIAAVSARFDPVAARKRQVPDEAELSLRDALSGVERHGIGARLGPVLRYLDRGEAERVLCFRLVERVHHQRHRAAISRVDLELGVELVALHRAVIAVAVALEARKIAEIVELPAGAAELRSELPGVVAARDETAGDRRPRRTVGGEDLDDAAGGVAVETRERAAHHLDAFRGAKAERRCLALAIGHGRRDAVRDQANATHAECRAAAEAARGDLQVLRVVVAVQYRDAWHSVQRLRQIDLRVVLADRPLADGVNGYRQLAAFALDARCADTDFRQHGDRRRALRVCRRAGRAREGGQPCCMTRADWDHSGKRLARSEAAL